MVNNTKYYKDIVQEDEFRNYVNKRIQSSIEDDTYSLLKSIPFLYKYRALSEYAVNDIINGELTLSSIGEFNDMFDGSIHRYGTADECHQAALKEWNKLNELSQKAGLPHYLNKDSFVEMIERHCKEESRNKFSLLEFLGTYVCSMSSKSDSNLMWSHYADSNQGLCIEYDFESLPNDVLIKKMIFPVAYTKTPVDLSDLLDDKENKVFKYPVDAAVQCAVLTKADVWKYEDEWRIVYVAAQNSDTTRRIHLLSHCDPVSIRFGYHFLKPFFYYDFNDFNEQKACERKIANFIQLLDYMETNNIKAAIMKPEIGGYILVPQFVSIAQIKAFMEREFTYNKPEHIRYYQVIQDQLFDFIEQTNN